MKVVIFFIGFLLSLAVSSAAPSEISRLPYLQDMTSHSVVIAWRTRTAMIGEVQFSPSETSQPISQVKESQTTRKHVIKLSNLTPFKMYRYKIFGNQAPLTDWISFKTFPEGNDAKFTFAVFGDSGTDSTHQKRIAALVAASHPDFVLHTGDVIYDGKTDADFDSKFFAIYGALAEHVPFFPALGNHDFDWDGGKPYLANFYLPQNSPGKGRYYSFNYAQAHFDALDSNQSLAPSSFQYKWFAHDLADSTQPIKIVYFHHPPYSSGFHGSSLNIRASLAPLLKRYHVTLVLNGHDHDYERSKPIRGTTYVVTGGGGADLYPAFESAFTAYTQTIYDFVLCKVDGLHIHLDAINEQGKVFDQDDLEISPLSLSSDFH